MRGDKLRYMIFWGILMFCGSGASYECRLLTDWASVGFFVKGYDGSVVDAKCVSEWYCTYCVVESSKLTID